MPLGLFVLGWLVYSVGFIWSLISSEKATIDPSEDPTDPTYFPNYIVLIGGPAIYVSGVLHAMLSGIGSALLGILVAFFNVLYFSSVSWIAYDRGLNVSSLTNGSSSTQPVKSDANSQAWFMFEGTLFALICWYILVILSVFYKNPEDHNTNLRRSQDCLFTFTRATHNSKRPFPGAARLLSVPFLILSLIGWCLFVVGYHQWNVDHEENTKVVIVFNDHTNPVVVAVLIVGPLLYLASLLHVGCSGRASTMGMFTAVLHVLYVVSSGFIITHLIRLKISSKLSTTEHSVDYMLGGCVASLLFWTLVYALRPFYQDFQVSGDSRVRGNVRNLSETPESVMAPGSPPPDYGTVTAHTAQMREGDHETQPLLSESAQ